MVPVLGMKEHLPPNLEHGYTGIRADAGSALCNLLGFTDDLFTGWIEVCADRITDKEIIYLHYINSKYPRRGNATKLIKQWVDWGFDVRIVQPEPETKRIISRLGFVEYYEWKDGCIPRNIYVEIWRRIDLDAN